MHLINVNGYKFVWETFIKDITFFVNLKKKKYTKNNINSYILMVFNKICSLIKCILPYVFFFNADLF